MEKTTKDLVARIGELIYKINSDHTTLCELGEEFLRTDWRELGLGDESEYREVKQELGRFVAF